MKTETTNPVEAKEWKKQLKDLVNEGKVKDVKVKKEGNTWVMRWEWTN